MSAKRRAGTGGSPDLETPGAKRQKINDDVMPTVETPETTTALGLKLVRTLKASCDKTGRLVATQFLDVPDKRQHPDYYQKIQSPMSINMIEAKLNDYEYENLDAVDMDFKALIANAKEFNERSSLIFEDAERIRKAISNFMPRYNPRYKDRNAKVQQTPLSRANSNVSKPPRSTEPRESDVEVDSKPKSLKLRLTNKRPLSLTPTIDESQTSVFANDDLQSAQERIMEELIQLKDASGREVALDFLELPSKRQYPEYYRQISHPVSLYGIQSQVKGSKKFSTWDDFRKEVSFIWDNAKSYNVDESSIFQDAERIEKFFRPRFAEARIHVKNGSENQDTATGPRRIKINPPSAPTPTTTPGVLVDDDALGRQRAMVRAGSSGQDVRPKGKTPINGSTSSSNSVPVVEKSEPHDSRRSPTMSPKPPSSTVTVEPKKTQSPAPSVPPNKSQAETSNVPAPANSAMPPPTAPPPPIVNGTQTPKPPAPAPYSVMDSKFRKPGKDSKDALIANVRVSTHPGIDVEDRFRMDFGPDDMKTQQSFAFHLHHDHYYLQVEVTLTDLCMSRPHKLIMARNFENFGDSGKTTTHNWRIKPGVNNITAEVIAGPVVSPPKGSSDPMEGYDFEKTILHVNLLSW